MDTIRPPANQGGHRRIEPERATARGTFVRALQVRRILVATALMLILRTLVDSMLDVTTRVPGQEGGWLASPIIAPATAGAVVLLVTVWLVRSVPYRPWLHAMLALIGGELLLGGIAWLLQLDLPGRDMSALLISWVVMAVAMIGGVLPGRRRSA